MNAGRNYFLFSDEPGEPGAPGAPRPRPCSVGANQGSLPPPDLLVHWEPRWRGFCDTIGPALGRSEPPLEGECRAGAVHGRNHVLSALLHLTALLVLISIPTHFVRSQQLLQADETRHYQVIYYSGNELPQMMHDAGGAQAGVSGRSGGRELYHPTQVIHIARGSRPVDLVVDAPRLKLPRSNGPLANLLTAPAFDPGPPPVASVPSSMSAVARALQPAAVAAPPEIRRERLASVPQYSAAMVNAPPDTHLQVAGLRVPELGSTHVIPPPVSAPARATDTLPKLTLPMSVAVAPPPIIAREVSSVGVPGFGAKQDIIPPPPQTSGGGAISGGTGGAALKSLGSLVGAGTGSAGGGTGAIVVSANPGTTVGVPATGGTGTIAMSPHGGNQPGLGGSGGGTGISRGNGPGSGSHGVGSGSAAAGSGPGSGAARPGTSPYPGPGGTGSGTGTAGIPGVTVVGGTVTIPGFSTPSNTAGGMSRGPADARARPAITIIATARSGGALNTYGVFKGSKVYTIYIDTRIGIAVMQYAERSASARGFEDDLTPPGALNSDFPADIKRSHLLLSCVLDTSGSLKNLRVVESDAAAERDKVIAALGQWRFRPVLRNNQPVEVDVMLGFNVDTR